MLSDELMTMKVTDIVILLAQRLDVSHERALDLFFNSQTCQRNPTTPNETPQPYEPQR